MPVRLVETDCSPLVIDHEYEVVDKDLLATYVGELVLGNHHHIIRVINSLAVTFPIQPDNSIDQVITKIRTASVAKRDGWLFQMMSWIVLSQQNVGNRFFSNYPHFAPAQHGIDGLAVILNDDNSLRKIVITEDKCTSQPRGKITSQVFPEFKEFEEGKKNNALVSIISSLLGQLDAGQVLEAAQNDIFKNEFRLYRVGITRGGTHNTVGGRRSLFLNYDTIVTGANPGRRGGATIHLANLRVWMEDFSNKVIAHLESKKSGNV